VEDGVDQGVEPDELDAIVQRLQGAKPFDTGVLRSDIRALLVEYQRLRARTAEPSPAATATPQPTGPCLEFLPDPALICDWLGLVVGANTPALEFFGFRSPAAIEGHVFRALLSPDAQAPLLQLIEAVTADGQAGRARVWISDATNTACFVEVTISPLMQPGVDNGLLLLTLIDRTADATELERSRLLEKALDSSPISLGIFDDTGLCRYANRQLLETLGVDRERLIDHPYDAWLSPSDAQKRHALTAGVRTSGVAHVSEELKRLPGDRERLETRYLFPVRDESQQVIATAEIGAPIHRQIDRHRKLQMSMTAYEMSRDAVCMTDAEGLIISVNSAFERITGFAEAEARGKNTRMLRSGRHSERFFKRMWQTLDEYGLWEGEIWNRRKSGEVYPQWTTISRVVDEHGRVVNYVSVFQDITQKKSIEEELEHLAFYDYLTGAANRHLLADRLDRAIRNAARENTGLALAFFDLDHFKPVNDQFGHKAGDRLLQMVAQRVQGSVREKDTLARVGGDEFVLLMTDIGGADLRMRLTRLLSEINRPYQIEDQEATVSASIGVAVYPADGASYEELMKKADNAMYEAKRAGRATIRYAGPAVSASGDG
jgi:diguanylate cyclase (GGDEF)-like protein/PAS domain S-box-containing protein